MSTHFEPHGSVVLYATDALSGVERRSFDDHCTRCERCQTELARLVETEARLAAPAEPPPALRARILLAARAETRR